MQTGGLGSVIGGAGVDPQRKFAPATERRGSIRKLKFRKPAELADDVVLS
jgi:hypothetical protein